MALESQRMMHLVATVFLALGATAGAAVSAAAEPQALARRMLDYPVVLLGERHDQAEHHALRLAALRAQLAAGQRPALVMEQLDYDRQAALEAARRERPGDAAHLIAQAGGSGWDWRHYQPFVQLALDEGLALYAGNLSRAQARRVVRSEDISADLPPAVRALIGQPLPAPLLRAQQTEIDSAHCGSLPAPLLLAMARAQILRDMLLAANVAEAARHGPVVLLAGNGHVRRDLGVALWLPALGVMPAQILTVGLGEPADAGRYDQVAIMPGPAQDDGAACAGLR